jgi:hypothetical protein
MSTAVLVFFYGCLCAGAWWAFAAWARRSVARHVDEGLKPSGNWAIVSDQFDNRGISAATGSAWSREDSEWGIADQRVNITLATALWKQHEAEWEAELARPYDWQQEGL